MGSALDAIKKRGHFKAHDKANKAYVEQRKLVKQAKATLAELDGTTSKGTGTSKMEAAATADTPEPDLQAMYQLDLKKAREATEKAKVKAKQAAQDMFQFYANLLSVDAKYWWNETLLEQTQSDP
jgi:hypothetical protein